jgi:hypothetical protein
MSPAEFIVETQWTLLFLLVLIPLLVAMFASQDFRNTVFARRWKLGPAGLEVEPVPGPSPEDLRAATQSDDEIAEKIAA